MSLPPQHAALLATVAVLWIALFPSGVGPFSATHGPATALSALACDILDFAYFQVSVDSLILLRLSYVHHRIWKTSILTADCPPVRALRC